jgi:hypothetical protein
VFPFGTALNILSPSQAGVNIPLTFLLTIGNMTAAIEVSFFKKSFAFRSLNITASLQKWRFVLYGGFHDRT